MKRRRNGNRVRPPRVRPGHQRRVGGLEASALRLPERVQQGLEPGALGPLLDRVGALEHLEVLRLPHVEGGATHVGEDPVVRRLTTLPGIGPITASAYVAALDDAGRFGGAAQVASYLGLVPREYSSGEQQRRGA